LAKEAIAMKQISQTPLAVAIAMTGIQKHGQTISGDGSGW